MLFLVTFDELVLELELRALGAPVVFERRPDLAEPGLGLVPLELVEDVLGDLVPHFLELGRALRLDPP